MVTDTGNDLMVALDVALVALRFAADDGRRTELDEVIEAFGCSRSELDSEN
ncbi:hypothetical protein EDF24_0395 [Curtobacterium sp. PhB130]|uniref:hypothetical protein n=1 Tax=unclassified Curtobacterium TaxID=257496 RepID=UPI000F92A4A6|nr:MULTISPECIES: hypothetical protein [unclassified Curtobacterium]ROP63372.1 hypothetical protein EDF55_2126 [Curtobacterium sp. ZW137]ROS77636.1 hypothetical protein EDF24_0395 [Curtobacterium sp. PhB130]TCK66156.1 hypothetical protein EDF27_0909 [Curtobacterium sp. PhB136]